MAQQRRPSKKIRSASTAASEAIDPKTVPKAQAITGSRWKRFVPPNAKGKFPWRWRWLGLVPILAACVLTGIWGWNRMEDNLHTRAIAHLDCEFGDAANDLDLDWSYRDVEVRGELPAGVTASQVEQVVDRGSSNSACLEDRYGIDTSDDPGVYDVSVLAAAALAAPGEPDPAPTAAPTTAPTPVPTATPEPEPTATPEPEPTATPEPEPTAIPVAALAATAFYDGQTVTLTGAVSSEEQRAALVAAAAAAVGATNVDDQLDVLAGDPTDDAKTRTDELASIIGRFGSGLVQGSATATDDAVTYELLAIDAETADAIDIGSGSIEVVEPATPEFTG